MGSTRIIPSRSTYFWTFVKIGLSGFGGVLPFARRALVEQKKWLDEAEFAELLGLGQSLPGPNIVNLVLMLGYRDHGVAGALLCVVAILLPPMVVMLLLVSIYGQYADVPQVRQVMGGIAAAAAGLILTVGVRMLLAQTRPHGQRHNWPPWALAGCTVGAMLLGAPLLAVLFGLTAAGLVMHARGWF
jgi:chromate transporter